MKLKLIDTYFEKVDTVLLSRTGVLRFKPSFIEAHKIKKDDRWYIALDEDDKDKYKSIYLLKDSGNHTGRSKKMKTINNSWYIECKNLFKYIDFNESIKCKYSKFSTGNMTGFCIEIPR